MIKFILVVIMVVGSLIPSIPLLIWKRRPGKKNPAKKNTQSLRIVRSVLRLILKVAGVHVTVEGLENVPTGRTILYVSNHHNYFDILAGYITIPTLLGFVAKKEMERYPLLSNWIHNVNYLFLDRENLKEGLRAILTGIERVKQGVSIWIFPEGTRDRGKDILELLPFKEGSLRIAERSGCPIIPVAVTGAVEVFEKQFPRTKSFNVTTEFGAPTIIRDLEPEQKKHAGAYVQSIIKDVLTREKTIKEGK